MAHHVNVFEINGYDSIWIEDPKTRQVSEVDYSACELNTMDVIRDVLGATGVSFSYHNLPEGDESPRSAPFAINQLEDDDYEFETEVFSHAWREAQDAHAFLATVVEPGTYQVVNRFGHAVGEEIEI